MSDAYQKLEHLIDFPAIVDFRIIVDAKTPEPLSKIKELCDSIEKDSFQEVKEPARKSRNGTYISYSVPVMIKSPEHLKTVYEKVGALDFVKHII